MLTTRAEKLRNAAGEPTMERIREDRQKAPPRLKPLLQYMEGHLYDSDFEVRKMRRACGVRDSAISSVFKKAIGEAPWDYVRQGRLEIATRMLRDSNLKIELIAELLGFKDRYTFSRSFARAYGVRPRAFRKSIQAVVARLSLPPVELSSIQMLKKAVDGDLDLETAALLIERVEAIYGLQSEQEQDAEPVRVNCAEAMANAWSAAVWQSIETVSFEVAAATVRLHGSRSLFDLLLERSREEGRRDPHRGVELARLAVECLDGCSEMLGEAVHDLRALGWAWVGNAWRLVPNLGQAEEAFLKAEASWSISRKEPDSEIEAHIWHLKASLRLFQRRFGEALKLEGRAIKHFRVAGDEHALAQSLLEASRIHGYMGSLGRGIKASKEALVLLGKSDDALLRLAAFQHLATSHVRLGQIDAGSKALRHAKRLCSVCGHPMAWLQVQWTEGLLLEEEGHLVAAEERLMTVRAGLLEVGADGDVAALELDLAILLASHGRTEEVVQLTTSVIAIFEGFGIHREPLAALKLRCSSVAAGSEDLQTLRAALENVRRLPWR